MLNSVNASLTSFIIWTCAKSKAVIWYGVAVWLNALLVTGTAPDLKACKIVISTWGAFGPSSSCNILLTLLTEASFTYPPAFWNVSYAFTNWLGGKAPALLATNLLTNLAIPGIATPNAASNVAAIATSPKTFL